MQFMVLPWTIAACAALAHGSARMDRPSLLIVAIIALTMLGLTPITPCAGTMLLSAILGGHALVIAAYLRTPAPAER